jgi:hypothetical protein
MIGDTQTSAMEAMRKFIARWRNTDRDLGVSCWGSRESLLLSLVSGISIETSFL